MFFVTELCITEHFKANFKHMNINKLPLGEVGSARGEGPTKNILKINSQISVLNQFFSLTVMKRLSSKIHLIGTNKNVANILI